MVILLPLKPVWGLNKWSKTSVLILTMSVVAKHPLSDRKPKIWKKACSSATGKRLDSAVKDQKNLNCDNLWFLHEPLIRIGIISWYTACWWHIVKKAKIFWSYAEHYWIFSSVRNCRILFGLCKLVFNESPNFLTQTIN